MNLSLIPWVPGGELFVLKISEDVWLRAPWLVYADWLDERGHYREAEFCRSLFLKG